MPTLKDVARLANVDVSTVSRALNNTAHVHPKTKERILKAAKDLGYRPNVVAQGLRKGRRHILGVVVPRFQLTIFAEVMQGIEREASRLGYTTIIANSQDDAKLEVDALSRMRDGFVDGIIIAGTGKNGRVLRDIAASGTPIVQVVRMQEQSISSVVADYYACARDAASYLIEKGCLRIGLINSSQPISPYTRRYEGYQDAIKAFGLPSIVVTSSRNPNSFDYGYNGTKQLIGQHEALDAIMVAVDIQGMGALRALKECGLHCPDDIRLISLTGHQIGSFLETGMTAMEVPSYEMGEKAARMLIEHIEAPSDRKPARQHLVFPPTLVSRESA